MINHWTIGALVSATLASATLASVSTYTSDISMISDITNAANFNGLVNEQSLSGYQEGGLELNSDRDYFSWNAPGLDGSEMFYANTGELGLIDITLVDGSDFSDMDMQISSGWSPSQIGTMYLWVQLYNDGGLVGEFDIDATTGEYIGLVGGGFDQVSIGSYGSAAIRDSHNHAARNAIAIDNISVGTYVPAPGTLMLSGLGLIGLRRRR
tara:strand:+ start:97411 stop:98040 length:630 start_codon:yes stop_codon:yes gene_type:complete